MVRPVCPQLRKCHVRPGSSSWCQLRTLTLLDAELGESYSNASSLVTLRSGVVMGRCEKGGAILLKARYCSPTNLGPDLVCSTSPAPVNGPLCNAHSASSIASTLAETSDPTSSRQFSTAATQKKSILSLIRSNLNSGRGSSLNGVADKRASNHCSKPSCCNASRSAPLHSAYKPRSRDSRANRWISLSVICIVLTPAWCPRESSRVQSLDQRGPQGCGVDCSAHGQYGREQNWRCEITALCSRPISRRHRVTAHH